MSVTEIQITSEHTDSTTTSCGEWVDDGGRRCGLPAVILDRYVLPSTDGPIEHVRTRCTAGHALHCSVASLA